MKKKICLALSFLMMASLVSCGGGGENSTPKIQRVQDIRNLSVYENTVYNLSATDKEGRTMSTVNGETKNNYVGLFYHIWQGYHTKNYGRVLDITKMRAEDPYFMKDTETDAELFHFWGEPLYGYYCSYDPWLTTRHIELLTMSGVDYLVYDLTNSVVYDQAINTMFATLDTYQKQGWDVPKVAFYLNSYSSKTLDYVYNTWYVKGSYSNLWFTFDEKPVIICDTDQLSEASLDRYMPFFDIKESQWPYNDNMDLENGFPWMDWDYPQKNYNGTMSVSLAQHNGAKMSKQEETNRGRGFDYSKFRNYSKNSDFGTNLQGQWQRVFDNNADPTNTPVNNVFVTGFNEWQAQKLNDGENVFFVDTFSEEYSRDIEMMKGGYADNYYLQNMGLVRQFKFDTAKHYIIPTNTIDIADATAIGWANVKSNFKDFVGDAMERNHINAFGSETYVDTSNRNDISDVSITHDANNLYLKVVTKDAITAYNGTDKNWMNVFIKTSEDIANSFGGYQYVINRTPNANGKTSVEKSTGGYAWQTAGEASYTVSGNVMQISIPLSALGLTKDNCYVQFKVTDNVTKYDDIMDYYVTGDSAPIGRLSYTYGY